ncbi:WAT1-related protein At3g28050-like isoform X3 [Diospyros lotus]|uniref:WAT1-related protein At3g28050-like isoform X3 n=1 Tax=Diospyros lotus TaxID=55363 RepID=UPI0022513487|nr:WAT1-related protein At3g28050-like isoform X3 [Diospyros lotus]XP_052173447.1 WAT1-related protein At3g28050-like isoform X3 [Diospyros lotus]
MHSTGNRECCNTNYSCIILLSNAQPGPRMEEIHFRRSSTLAKTTGTLVSIIGALIVILYKGPSIVMTLSLPNTPQQLLMQRSNFVIGGVLLIIDCVAASAFIITQVVLEKISEMVETSRYNTNHQHFSLCFQALLLARYSAELIIVFFYCFFVAIMSAMFSLVVERDLAAWSLQPTLRLLTILYSGLIGSAAQVSIITWCLHKRGPVFVAMFHPLGIIIAAAVDIIFLGDSLYLGSMVGSIVIVIGFYSVMWGKANEAKVKDNGASSLESSSEQAPLLQSTK